MTDSTVGNKVDNTFSNEMNNLPWKCNRIEEYFIASRTLALNKITAENHQIYIERANRLNQLQTDVWNKRELLTNTLYEFSKANDFKTIRNKLRKCEVNLTDTNQNTEVVTLIEEIIVLKDTKQMLTDQLAELTHKQEKLQLRKRELLNQLNTN